jgi:nitroreductase
MEDFLSLIKKRKSSRVLFDPDKPVKKEDLRKILEAGSWAPTAHNMQNFEIVIVTDRSLINTISSIKAPISLTFVRENYRQLSFSEEELKKKKTGVLGTMFPLAWQKPNIKKSDITEADRNTFMEEELNSTPVLGIVLYDPTRRAPDSKGDFLGIVSLGCVMENMWLMASALGMHFHIVSSLSSKAMEKEIKKLLHIPKPLVIAYSFRLGFAKHDHQYLRVRREVEDFAYQNIYGSKW